MGWWWDKDPQKPVLKPSDEIPDPTPTPSEPPASTRELVDGNVPRHSADQEVEQELEKFLNTTATTGKDVRRKFDHVSAKARQSLGLPPKPSPSNDETHSDFTAKDGPELDDEEHSMFPDTMSCRTAFDRAFYCNSLGGQINNVYRYGSARDCKANWGEFWFCMKLKSQDEQSQRRKIREWYMRKEAEIKLGSSSEDVWEVRREPLTRAFDKNPDV